MTLAGMVIDRSFLSRLTAAPVRTPGATVGAIVSAEVIADCKTYNPQCKCDQGTPGLPKAPKLVPGLPVSDLIELEEGCTRGIGNKGICGCLDAVRRRYGK